MAIRSGIKDPTGTLVTESDIAARAVVNDHLNQHQGPNRTYTFEYDFAEHGGAAGAITLTDADPRNSNAALVIPDNFLVLDAWVEGITTATSGGSATVKLGITGNDDCFCPATAYNNGEFDAGVVTIVGSELPLKMTADVSVLATIATADLTAGKFWVHVEGRLGA